MQWAKQQRPGTGIELGNETIAKRLRHIKASDVSIKARRQSSRSSAVVTLQPGQQTGWHTHPAPLFGYVLEGELTVDYGAKGQWVYRKGEALAEAMNEAHNGRNAGQDPVKILAVFIGMEVRRGVFQRRLRRVRAWTH